MKEKVVGRAELDTAQAEVESLKARIALAQQQVEVARAQVQAQQTDLADMVVRAPFDGVAISKDAQPGEMISPVSAGGGFTRTGICTIVDMSSLEIEVDVSESYINRVRPGQPVEAVLDAYPDWRIPAHVITTVPTADRQKATVRGAASRLGRPDESEAARSADPAGHGRQGVVPAANGSRRRPRRQRAAAAGAEDRGAHRRRAVRRVRREGRPRRTPRGEASGAADGDQVEVISG